MPAVDVVVVPSLERVMRDDVNVKGEKSAKLGLAKGETESFQIVVVNRGTEPLKSVSLRWTELSGESSPAPTIRPYREHYVEVKTASFRQDSKPGWYPDALIPFIDPYTGTRPKAARYDAWSVHIAPGQAQGYWLDVTAGSEVAAGVYRGVVQATGAGMSSREIEVSVEVWGFTLPPSPSLVTHFGVSGQAVAKSFGTPVSSAATALLRQRILHMLSMHRLTVLGIPAISADAASGHAIIPANYLHVLKQTVSERHLTLCHLPLTRDWPIPDALNTNRSKLVTFISDISHLLAENPWIPPVFVYVIDEPDSKEEYASVRWLGGVLQSSGGRILNLVPGALKERPAWGSLGTAVDIGVYHLESWDPELVRRRKDSGQHIWAYTALRNANAPSWLLDAPLLEHMVPFWVSWSTNLEGFLYWTVLCSGPDGDPWRSPSTYITRSGAQFNGEGSLVLAGRPAGIEGPVPTIRLKIIRDAIDCHDYLSLLAARSSVATADRIARSVAPSFSRWETDYNAFMTARSALATEILASPVPDGEPMTAPMPKQ